MGAVAERIWSAAFSGANLFVRPRSGMPTPGGAHQRVLVIAPHPDDESIGCAGTILLHLQAGAQVTVACVTDGRASRALGLGAEEMARRRRREAEACARLLGIDDLDWFGLPEGAWSEHELHAHLDRAMTQHRPSLVYAPSRIDFHPEHRKVARALARLWSSPAARPRVVRIYPVQVPLTPVLANLAIDVTAVIVQARTAMEAYATQRANIPRAFRQRRYAGRYYRAGDFAEEFWELTTEEYSRVHQAPDAKDSGRFRGLREHPISDPLAYTTGYLARRRLAARS